MYKDDDVVEKKLGGQGEKAATTMVTSGVSYCRCGLSSA